MKKWVIKAVVQKIISWLPGSHRINYLFQKYITKGVYLSDEYFYDRLGHGIFHLNSHLEKSKSIPEKTFELGTGWYPVVPVAFFLCGSSEIVTTDITPLTDAGKLKTTLRKFIEAEKSGKLNDLPLLPERMLRLKSLAETNESNLETLLKQLHIVYLNADARKLNYPDKYFDLIHSNNVYEHIYPEILKDIIREFKRLIKEHGTQCHFIDMSDHFAHADSSITIYNYLQFTEKQWRRIDNSVQPQNRLRMPQYREMYAELGIPIRKTEFRPGNFEDVRCLKLAKPFSEMDPVQVAISHAYLVS